MKSIKIERGRKPPPRRGGVPRYPFAAMKRGDNFYVKATADAGPTRTMRRIVSAAARHRDKAFTTRIEGNGVRTWRVK